MSTRQRNSEPQNFCDDDVIKWQIKIESVGVLEKVKQLFRTVTTPPNQLMQLKAVKQMGVQLQRLSTTQATCYETVVRVLVEMHSCCGSRHPLQRTISSMLHNLPACEQSVVVKHVAETLEGMLHVASSDENDSPIEHFALVTKRIQYIEVLMENFRPGETALKQQLPQALEYLSLEMVNCSSHGNRYGVDGLVILLKVTMNMVQKLSPIFHIILNQNETVDATNTETFESLSWPLKVTDNSPTEKRQWAELQLSKMTSACEEILLRADEFLNDATVTAAMLSVALFNASHRGTLTLLPGADASQLQSLTAQVDHWLSPSLFKPFPQLAMCYALLAKLPTAVLIVASYDNKPLLIALFPVICKLFNVFTESSDRYIGARTLALWTSVAGDCVQGVSEESPVSRFLLPSGDVVQTVLQYIWSLWEDPIDGIRHQCKDMFQNTIKIYKQLQATCSEDLLLSLAKNLVSFESPTRGKYILLSTLSQHISVKKLLEVSPQLPSELMDVMGHQALACHAGELWSRLVSLHWRAAADAEDEDDWSKIWVCTLVETMHFGSPLARKHITQYCLQSLFQNVEKTMEYVVSLQEFAPSGNSRLTTQLACLRCARMCNDFTSFGESFSELFKIAMLHTDEQICLSALFLVCETHRTTEPPELSHLSLLLQFVEINANSQSPGFRYPVLNAFKKLFVRIRDSSYAMLKMYQKGRIPNPHSQIKSYQEFIQTLMMQQFKELHPLSSFQRRNFSLSLLQLIAAIFDQPPEGLAQLTAAESQSTSMLSQLFSFSAAVTEEQAKRLLEALHDPYDANRSICLELLLKLPNEKIGFHVVENISWYCGVYFRLVGSPKSASCAAGAFYLRLLLQKCCVQFNSCLQSLIDQGCESDSQMSLDDEPPFCQTIAFLCKLLERHMAVAKEDLVAASMVAPMYGVLLSIQTVWEVEQSFSCSPLSWLPYREIVAKVVKLCIEVTQLVSPVVCCSSPEGFLPDSPHSEREGELLVQVRPLSSASTKAGGTAQSLLLCSWHSMKEIALLLGYLVEYAPVISGTTGNGVLTHAQLDSIAGIFIHQLTEARHRGAFEMAYTGFSKLCQCLWSNSSPELKMKPSSWVQELLDSLQSTSLARLLSITRRSAGLPFYIQAILTAEPAHTGRSCFKRTMKTLLQIAKESGLTGTPPDPEAVDQSTKVAAQPAAVHALNILRALFRDSRLGEIIVPFIPEAVEIAIKGFSASLWPVRNSSTLLFSALITRLFGAKRVQDEHSMENKMTAREFFTRFPTLHGFLQRQLSLSVEQLTNNEESSLQPTLFPVLLLLSRLYPSPLDETNSPTSLQSFLPLILSCTACSVWKTRVLACSVLISILSEHNITSVLQDLYQGMELHHQNKLHGHLLVIEKLLNDRPKLLSVFQNGETVDCILFKHHIENHWIASSINTCGITRQLYLEILVNLLELVTAQKALPSLAEGRVVLSQFVQLLSDCNETLTSQTSSKPVQPVFFADSLLIAQLKLLQFVSRNRDKFFSSVTAQPTVEDILHQTFQDDYSLAVRTFSLQYLNSSSYSLSAPESIVQTAVHIVLHETDADLLIQAYEFIGKLISRGRMVDKVEKVTEVAYHLCLRRCNRLELKLTLIGLVTSIMVASMDISLSTKYLPGWLSHFEKCCVPTQPFEIRIAIANTLSQLLPVLKQLSPSNQAEQLLKLFCKLVVTVLQDSDSDVRLSMATEVAKLLPGGSVYPDVESPNSPTALQWFVSSLPAMIKDDNVCFYTLLSLLPCTTSQARSSTGRNNPLFDEDPLNDYAEDLVVLDHVIKCIDHVIINLIDTHRLSKQHLDSLAKEVDGSAPCDLNSTAWDKPEAFMNSVRRTLFRNILKNIHKRLKAESLSSDEDKLVRLLEHLEILSLETGRIESNVASIS